MAEGLSQPVVRHALLAEANESRREAMQRVLSAMGLKVLLCTAASELPALAREHSPALIYVDTEFPGLDTPQVARILRRCRETTATRFIASYPGEWSDGQLEPLRAAGVRQMLPRPLARSAVTAAIEQALQEHAVLLAALPPAPVKPVLTQHVESNNSLLVREVCCPFHDEPVRLQRYMVRTGRMVTEVDYFDLAVYKSAARSDFDFVDHTLLAIMVCPTCWFATNEPGYLLDPADLAARRITLLPGTYDAIVADTPNRQAIAAAASETLFTEHRDIHQAMVCYRLAIASSTVLREQNRYNLAIESLRLANFHLRLRRLREQTGDDGFEDECTPAVRWLEEAFANVEGPAIFKAAYQLVALSLWAGDDRTAFQYISRVREMQQDTTLDKAMRSAAERYLNRCQTIWEDREMHRRPDLAAAA